MKFINVEMISNPINWIIVWLMVVIGVLGITAITSSLNIGE